MIILWRGKKAYVSGWEPNAPERCELCGVEGHQLRPFHPDGKFICYECGEKNQPQTDEIMGKIVKECDFVFRCEGDFDIYRFTEEEVLGLIDSTANFLPETKTEHDDI